LESIGTDTESSAEARVIKRYANRKLYDTRESRYVTLQQIAEYVRVGEDVQIIDNKTKEDLTNVTLAQIVYEQERGKEPERNAARGLRDMIREGRERLLTSILDGPVGKLMPHPHDHAHGEEKGEKPEKTEHKRSVLLSPKEALDELQRLADDRIRGLLGGALQHVQQLQSEVTRLQQRIEELESRLAARGAEREENHRE
jgi:polyhydroxyalkanoate synthesis repressor PhaR